MMSEYVGYIKQTKSGKYRPALGSLHDVGEPDGDRSIMEVASGEMFEDLNDAVAELDNQCDNSKIEFRCHVPFIKGQILFENYLKELEREHVV